MTPRADPDRLASGILGGLRGFADDDRGKETALWYYRVILDMSRRDCIHFCQTL